MTLLRRNAWRLVLSAVPTIGNSRKVELKISARRCGSELSRSPSTVTSNKSNGNRVTKPEKASREARLPAASSPYFFTTANTTAGTVWDCWARSTARTARSIRFTDRSPLSASRSL